MNRAESNKRPVPALVLDCLALLGGVVAPFAFAPFDFGPVIFISLIFLFFCWQRATAKRAFLRGFLFGFGQFGVGSSWVYISMHEYGGASVLAAGVLTFVFVVVLALFPAVVGFIVRFCFKPFPVVSLVVVYPTVWTLAEWCRSWTINGFPWLQVGYTQLDSPLAGFIPLTGVYGESWLVASMAGMLVTVGLIPKWTKLVPVVIVCLVFVVGDYFKGIEWTHPIGKPFKATLLQGNVPQDIKWLPEQKIRTLNLYAGLTRNHWDSQVIVWPETAVPAFFHQVEKAFLLPLKREAIRHGTDLVLGVPVWEESVRRSYNAIITLAEVDGIYKKRHLVPFGEYLPLQPLSGFIADILQIPLSDFSAGDDRQAPMRAAGYPFVASICYEDIYGDESLVGLPEAAYLVNVTNDAWFGDSIAPRQHLQMARMRSLETGRYMLRATNTGITAVISPSGKLIRTAPMFQTVALNEEITPMGGSTPYIHYGDKPVIVGCFILLAVAFLYHTSTRNQRS